MSLQAASGSDGSFATHGVPAGQYDVLGSVSSGGITYNVIGTSLVNSDVTVSVIPLGPADIKNHVISVTTTPISGAPAMEIIDKKQPNRSRSRAASSLAHRSLITPSGPFGNAITASADAQDVPVTASATYTIPKGTNSIVVEYQVCTEEYPVFVDAQSEFNDLWSIFAVDANGNGLLSDSHNVNEELSVPPVWQGDGCTVILQPAFDVSSSTSQSSTTITVTISATNIGDSILPTTVTAIVTSPSDFSIKSFDLDNFLVVDASDCTSSISNDTENIEVCEGANDGDYVSIPSGKSNTFKRPATAILDFPADKAVTVNMVELDVVDVSGNVLDTVFNEPPGTNVQMPDPRTLTLSSTYVAPLTAKGSLIAVLPDRMSFQIIVTGTQNGANVSARQNLAVFNTLWSAVDSGVGIGRYGQRDLGGDDWAIQNTIQWLKANAALITRYDDVSGEHGRNLGHRSHGRGTEVDIFQFTSLDATSGINNYNALRDAALKAVAGDVPSIQAVAGWVKDNRAGIDALSGNANVRQVITGLGRAAGVLPTGWLKQAMLTGKIPRANGAPVDLGLGAASVWAAIKIPAFDPGHNSHVHVSLTF